MTLASLLAAPALGQAADPRLIPPDTATAETGLGVEEAYPGLLQRAAVTPAMAVRAALAKVKKGEVVRAQIEERGTHLVYVLRVDERGKRSRELLVDAASGRVLSNRKLSRRDERGP